MIKDNIRLFLNKPIRAIWDNETLKWWYSSTDVLFALTNSTNPRVYWNAVKNRNPELSTYCRQLKLYANDGKKYLSDVIDEKGIKKLGHILPCKNNKEFEKWLYGNLDSFDEQSKKKALDLFESSILDLSYVGKTELLQQIHGYLYEGLYSFAGQIRTETITEGELLFAKADFLPRILNEIDEMPDSTFSEIVDKYVEIITAHPFLKGNGRSIRIWLDLLLKERINKCIDWTKIEKDDYLSAINASLFNPKLIFNLLENALTDDINNRELFIKGIDHSYHYDET